MMLLELAEARFSDLYPKKAFQSSNTSCFRKKTPNMTNPGMQIIIFAKRRRAGGIPRV